MSRTTDGDFAGKLENSSGYLVPRMPLTDDFTRRGSESRAARGMFGQVDNCGSQRLGISRRHEHAAYTVIDQFTDLADSAGYNRSPGGHVLQHFEWGKVEFAAVRIRRHGNVHARQQCRHEFWIDRTCE